MKYLIIPLLWFSTVVNSFSQSHSSFVVLVTDKDSGRPISNASVIIKEAGWATKTTGSDGKAYFDKSMPTGEIHYIISKEGYQGVEGAFNITTEEKSNTLNLKLSKFRDDMLLVTGEVVDEDDRDLEGAIVEVKVADIVQTAKTDASGNYKIELTLNKSKYDVSTLKLEAKCNNGNGKKVETIDLTRRNVIYKDFKLSCDSNIKEIPSVTVKGDTSVKVKNQPLNINTGTNNGIIGNENQINVNVKEVQRQLDNPTKTRLLQLINFIISDKKLDKNPCIMIFSIASNESFNFARQIQAFLKLKGYSAEDSIGTFQRAPPVIGAEVGVERNCVAIWVGFKP